MKSNFFSKSHIKNTFIHCFALIMFIFSGCKTYVGYREYTTTIKTDVENESIVKESYKLGIDNNNCIELKKTQEISFDQHYQHKKYEDFVYYDVSMAVWYVLFPFSVMYYPFELLEIPFVSAKNVYYPNDSDVHCFKFKYSAGRQIWNLINYFNPPALTNDYNVENNHVATTYTKQRESKTVNALLKDELLDITDNSGRRLYCLSGQNLQELSRLFFKHALPEKEIQAEFSYQGKAKLQVRLKSSDLAAPEICEQWQSVKSLNSSKLTAMNKNDFAETKNSVSRFWQSCRDKNIFSDDDYRKYKGESDKLLKQEDDRRKQIIAEKWKKLQDEKFRYPVKSKKIPLGYYRVLSGTSEEWLKLNAELNGAINLAGVGFKTVNGKKVACSFSQTLPYGSRAEGILNQCKSVISENEIKTEHDKRKITLPIGNMYSVVRAVIHTHSAFADNNDIFIDIKYHSVDVEIDSLEMTLLSAAADIVDPAIVQNFNMEAKMNQLKSQWEQIIVDKYDLETSITIRDRSIK